MKTLRLLIFGLTTLTVNAQNSPWQLCNSGSCNYFNRCFIESQGFLLSTGCISNDNGFTWTIPGGGISALCFEKNSTGIFAGSDSSIYFSNDNGISWTPSYVTGPLNFVFDLAMLNDTIFAATRISGILMSPDNGISWSSSNTGLPTDTVYSVMSNGSLLFAGTAGNGLYVSSNSGISWGPANSGLPLPCSVYDMAVDNQNIYVSTRDALYLSGNNGLSWTLSPIPSTHINRIITVGNILLAGCWNVSGSEGLFRSTDNGTSWALFDNGLPNSCPYSVGALYATSSYVICGLGESMCPSPVDIYRIPISEIITSVNEINNSNSINLDVFPNPFINEINFELNDNSISEIVIYDLAQRVVLKQTFSGTVSLKTSQIAKGLYTYKIQIKNGFNIIGQVVKN